MNSWDYDLRDELETLDEIMEGQKQELLDRFGIEDEAEFEPITRTKPREDKAHRSPRQNRKDKKFRELRQTKRKL
jgi:hypothetical protein